MSTGDASSLCREPAVEIRRRLWAREVSVLERTEATLRVIEQVNPTVNAVVTLVAKQALQGARGADQATPRGGWLGPLHGLLVAHKT